MCMPFKGIALPGVFIAFMAGTSVADEASLVERLQLATDRAEQENCKSSLAVLNDVVSEKAFAALPEEKRLSVFELANWYAAEANDNGAKYRYALEGTRLSGASEYIWHTRFALEMNDERYAAVAETLEAMTRANRAALNALKIEWLARLNRKLRDNGDTLLQARVLQVLTDNDYRPADFLLTGDNFKLSYAEILAEQGKTAEATALLERVVEPQPLIGASVDRRLRALVKPDFDARAIVEARLAQMRDIAVAHPGSMAAVLEMADYLRQLGRPEETLATLEAAHPDRVYAVTFSDLDDNRNWWWDSLSKTYAMLGRDDEAVSAMGKAGAISERGELNVSQALNLGHLQLELGKPAEALETVSVFDDGKRTMSPYGEMVLRLVRGCALLALGRAEVAKPDLAYAASHEKDHPSAAMTLPLCAGDMDAAAAVLIRRLDSPDQHVGALLQFSDYDPPPVGPPFKGLYARLPELKARADVQAAIARAGGVRRFHLQYQ
ncbi:hypothetical protein [Sphingosinicella sp.]|uniref:hypothetical protein n=1 Tax=Sphingosinicella sp. TaxID=1917971 RepID=UPI0026152163|nr:hypothetical protein [Sphingosinicella sp.]